MIVIGIPTYNEADNISDLTRTIDRAASQLGINILLINADSASTDDTVRRFMNTPTKHEKKSIHNNKKGKGYNVLSIISCVSGLKKATGCVLVDGDITSFNSSWLASHASMIDKEYDYIIPAYSRNYQEGNTTNHFIYPLIGMHFNGKAPRQPIAGDFGISKRFAKYITKQSTHKYTRGYGIDVFLTLHALYGGYKVAEIPLDRKLHKPSFGKMIEMFEEVASSYYETTKELRNNIGMPKLSLELVDPPGLIETRPIATKDIKMQRQIAATKYADTPSIMSGLKLRQSTQVKKELWLDILIAHEQLISEATSQKLARSVLPWYLMRVVTYLEGIHNATSAMKEIRQQFELAVRRWNSQTTYDKKEMRN